MWFAQSGEMSRSCKVDGSVLVFLPPYNLFGFELCFTWMLMLVQRSSVLHASHAAACTGTLVNKKLSLGFLFLFFSNWFNLSSCSWSTLNHCSALKHLHLFWEHNGHYYPKHVLLYEACVINNYRNCISLKTRGIRIYRQELRSCH